MRIKSLENKGQLVLTCIFFTVLFFLSTPTTHAGSMHIPILMYHYIGNNPHTQDTARTKLSVSPQQFTEELNYLASQGYTPITLDTLYAIQYGKAESPTKPVVLTFDDGYEDFYFNAYPLLRNFGFHAVAFIPTGLINQKYFMTWDQIREIQHSGLVAFEGHSVNHVNLTKLTDAELNEELKQSKITLESVTGHPVNWIAYPSGRVNRPVQNKALQLGYVGGVTTHEDVASSISMTMPRVRIGGTISLTEFIRLIEK